MSNYKHIRIGIAIGGYSPSKQAPARNATVPAIDRVIFNDPATIVFFADGSKVTVKTSANDKFDYERGIIYAVFKRVYGDVDPVTGEVSAPGLYGDLNRLIRKSVDQQHGKATVDEVLNPRKYEARREAAKTTKIAEQTAAAKRHSKKLDRAAKRCADLISRIKDALAKPDSQSTCNCKCKCDPKSIDDAEWAKYNPANAIQDHGDKFPGGTKGQKGWSQAHKRAYWRWQNFWRNR